MPPSNVLTEWSSLLLRSFADAGIEDVVISPGSRSTPLVVAAVREPRLRLHNVIDERAAAFFALGQARLTRRPSLLVCTSGTAGAHYLPAIIEARAAQLPLLVLTADRPPELQDCSASQTIDQVKLFAGSVNHYFDLGTPEATASVLFAVRRMAAQAIHASTSPTPGAVHLNARIRKPLEPVLASTPEERAVVALAATVAAHPVPHAAGATAIASEAGIAHVAALCAASARGIIACGPAAAAQADARADLFALARATGFPIACDASSQLRFTRPPSGVTVLDALDDLAVTPWFRANAPDLVLQVGAPLVSSAWESLAVAAPRVVVAEHGWNDPQSRAVAFLHGDVAATARALAKQIGAPARDDYAARLREANALAWEAKREVLDAAEALTEGHVARAVAAALPAGSTWMLGNSLAVRVVDQYCPQAACEATVLSQRGAAGIDGLVAGAAGAASRANGPVTLLLGDISLLHDLTSLALAQRSRVPLVVVVLNNGGGRIFEQLPLAAVPALEDEIMVHTTTPHELALEHAGTLFGVAWRKVSDEAGLRAALEVAYGTAGCTVIEARVADHGNAAQVKQVRVRVDALLAGRP